MPLLLAIAACAWLLLLLSAPLAAAGVQVSAATYALGSFICHQQSARSFHLHGAQLPVCARCSGLYASAACGALAWLALGTRVRLDTTRLRTVLVASAVPTVVTWSGEAAGLLQPTNLARAIAALPLGLAVGAAVIATAEGRLR